MGHGDHLNGSPDEAIDDLEWELAEEIPAGPVHEDGQRLGLSQIRLIA